MYKKLKEYKNKRGFTLIELIVVMAIIGILVLLTAPRFLGKTNEAVLTNIKNDIRVAEDKVTELLVSDDERLKDWSSITATDLDALATDDTFYGRGGTVLQLKEGKSYKQIPSEFLNEAISTTLEGDFYSNDEGDVLYRGTLKLANSNEDNTPEEKALTYDEWVAKMESEGYTMATDASFDGDADGLFRYIGEDALVIVPNTIKGVDVTSYNNLFRAKAVEGVASFNPNVTNMGYMFSFTSSATLDVSALNTSGVTDMNGMFRGTKASNLDLSGFETSDVTNMSSMFYYAYTTSFDLTSFDTAKVTTMSAMFYNTKANTLDLSSFDTANVNDSTLMFSGSYAKSGYARRNNDIGFYNKSSSKPSDLIFEVREQPVNYVLATDADFTGEANGAFRYNGVSHYVIIPDTIKGVEVTSYDKMFNLTDVRGVVSDNPNVTDMYGMFLRTYASTLDVSVLNTSGVTNMRSMFHGAKAATLDLSNFDTSSVTDMNAMFFDADTTSYDLTSFDTTKVTDMGGMFYSTNPDVLDLSSFDTVNVKESTNMFSQSRAKTGYARRNNDIGFYNKSSNKPIDLIFEVREQAVNYVLATDADFTGEANGVFRYNGVSHYVIIPDTIKGVEVTSYDRMFYLTDVRGVVSNNLNVTDMNGMFLRTYASTLDVSVLNTSGVTNMRSMFHGAKAATLDLSNFDTSSVTVMNAMFYDADTTSYNLTSFDTTKVTDMGAMFYSTNADVLDLSSFDTANVRESTNMFSQSRATTGYARTTADMSVFDRSSYIPDTLIFTVPE